MLVACKVIKVVAICTKAFALERQDLSRMYLAHHELESIVIIIVILLCYWRPSMLVTGCYPSLSQCCPQADYVRCKWMSALSVIGQVLVGRTLWILEEEDRHQQMRCSCQGRPKKHSRASTSQTAIPAQIFNHIPGLQKPENMSMM